MMIILTIWFILCLFTLLLMALTDNALLYYNDLKKFLIFNNFLSFCFSVVILFIYLPLNITYLLGEVFKKK
jgi:hypothetical protein